MSFSLTFASTGKNMINENRWKWDQWKDNHQTKEIFDYNVQGHFGNSAYTHLWDDFHDSESLFAFHLSEEETFLPTHRLVGLVVKASASRAEDPGDRIFSGSSHTNDLKIGTPVVSLLGAWCYRVSAGTGWPSVSILWLREMESLACNFYLSVAARKIVWAGPSLRYTSMLLGCYATNKQQQPIHPFISMNGATCFPIFCFTLYPVRLCILYICHNFMFEITKCSWSLKTL